MSAICTPRASIDKVPTVCIFLLRGVAGCVTNTVLFGALLIIWFPCIWVDCMYVRMHMCDVCGMCTLLVFVGSRACALLQGDTKCPALPHAALFT